MTVSKSRAELIDGLLSDYKNPEYLLGENGILKQLTRPLLIERLKPRWSTISAMAWQMHPLDRLYPIAYLDCIHVKVRDNGMLYISPNEYERAQQALPKAA